MKKKHKKVDPLMIPVAMRLVPLHIVETTELFMGITPKTRYLEEIKSMILGCVIR
jgi:hypothetical protein